MTTFNQSDLWALILGGSSGFGLASAKRLAQSGLNLCIVHRDRRGAMGRIEEQFEEIRKEGVELKTFNINALSPAGRKTVLDELVSAKLKGKVRLLLHSIAFGSLKLIAPEVSAEMSSSPHDSELLLDDEELATTVYAMGTSLLSWTQELFRSELLAADARIIGLTSEGNEVAWKGYAAVSAAKAALEALSRSIAKEFGPHGVRANIIQPGVTDTPALRMIPGNERLRSEALHKNPLGRLTTVDDVAKVVLFMTSDEASWINGSILRVDGGEHIAG